MSGRSASEAADRGFAASQEVTAADSNDPESQHYSTGRARVAGIPPAPA